MTNDKILSVINKYSMLSEGDTVVVGVSGGADSMCLLHFFNKISSNLGLNIICAHVHHGIRGEEADRDESFVRDFCNKNRIVFRCAHYNVPEIVKTTGESEELCGRRLRYDFFSSFGESIKIATAHNLNDSAETFLFNLARGTGLKGLTGIPPVRGNIIRPLIECSRQEIEEYLEDNGVDYITDSTNLSDDYSRNKIRHNILPVLAEINPSFYSVFLRCTDSLSKDEDYLNKIVNDIFSELNNCGRFSVQEIAALDESVKKRLLIKIAEYYGAKNISYSHTELLCGILLKGGAVMLCGGVTVCSDCKMLYKKEEPTEEIFISEKYRNDSDFYVFPRCKLRIEPIDKCDIKTYNNKIKDFMNLADADKLAGSVFRSRLPGDRFKYPNAEHSKSLKNLFKEKNITPSKRFGIPMLANENNILWINGVGVSDFAKVTEETDKIVRIVISEQ